MNVLKKENNTCINLFFLKVEQLLSKIVLLNKKNINISGFKLNLTSTFHPNTII